MQAPESQVGAEFVPFRHTSGPRSGAAIAIVGEAWGSQEAVAGVPFVGASGQELTRMLREAGIDRSSCFLTNVFPLQPPGNDINALCVSKKELPDDYHHPKLGNRYLRLNYLPHLDRLRTELDSVRPNVVVALGGTASWSLLGKSGISSVRGVVAASALCEGLKVLPTYHPAAILRQPANRPIVIADLLKANHESTFPEIRRPRRLCIINPSLGDIESWAARPHSILAVDIETRAGQIRTIQFARSPYEAITIPFWINGNYWKFSEEEEIAWGWVDRLLSDPCPKVFQNGVYDLTYLIRAGFRPKNVAFDTMLHHHALYPEMQKGLGFLGSIYTNEASWKLMHRHHETKADDE